MKKVKEKIADMGEMTMYVYDEKDRLFVRMTQKQFLKEYFKGKESEGLKKWDELKLTLKNPKIYNGETRYNCKIDAKRKIGLIFGIKLSEVTANKIWTHIAGTSSKKEKDAHDFRADVKNSLVRPQRLIKEETVEDKKKDSKMVMEKAFVVYLKNHLPSYIKFQKIVKDGVNHEGRLVNYNVVVATRKQEYEVEDVLKKLLKEFFIKSGADENLINVGADEFSVDGNMMLCPIFVEKKRKVVKKVERSNEDDEIENLKQETRNMLAREVDNARDEDIDSADGCDRVLDEKKEEYREILRREGMSEEDIDEKLEKFEEEMQEYVRDLEENEEKIKPQKEDKVQKIELKKNSNKKKEAESNKAQERRLEAVRYWCDVVKGDKEIEEGYKPFQIEIFTSKVDEWTKLEHHFDYIYDGDGEYFGIVVQDYVLADAEVYIYGFIKDNGDLKDHIKMDGWGNKGDEVDVSYAEIEKKKILFDKDDDKDGEIYSCVAEGIHWGEEGIKNKFSTASLEEKVLAHDKKEAEVIMKKVLEEKYSKIEKIDRIYVVKKGEELQYRGYVIDYYMGYKDKITVNYQGDDVVCENLLSAMKFIQSEVENEADDEDDEFQKEYNRRIEEARNKYSMSDLIYAEDLGYDEIGSMIANALEDEGYNVTYDD